MQWSYLFILIYFILDEYLISEPKVRFLNEAINEMKSFIRKLSEHLTEGTVKKYEKIQLW
jgi:predicted  nucleic acid-binding Zn-ribbon protein